MKQADIKVGEQYYLGEPNRRNPYTQLGICIGGPRKAYGGSEMVFAVEKTNLKFRLSKTAEKEYLDPTHPFDTVWVAQGYRSREVLGTKEDYERKREEKRAASREGERQRLARLLVVDAWRDRLADFVAEKLGISPNDISVQAPRTGRDEQVTISFDREEMLVTFGDDIEEFLYTAPTEEQLKDAYDKVVEYQDGLTKAKAERILEESA